MKYIQQENKTPEEDYWTWRSASFSDSQWAEYPELRERIVATLCGKGIRSVVDIGCGVGHLCRTLHRKGYSVVGIDRCWSMIDMASRNSPGSINYQVADACNIPFPDNTFDAATIRMVLHNVQPQWFPVLEETHRILKKKGRLLVVEGFPPGKRYMRFFKMVLAKEHSRHFFLKKSLLKSIKSAGFEIELIERIIVPNISVASWLANSVPDEKTRQQIMRLHRNMPELCKRAYNMKKKGRDLLINLTFFLILASCTKI